MYKNIYQFYSQKPTEIMKHVFIIIFSFLFIISCESQTRDEIIAKNQDLDSNRVVLPVDHQQQVDLAISALLSRFHYRNAEVNDSLSSMVFDAYIETMDNNKMYFFKKDVDEFEKYRYTFDNFIETGELDEPFEIFNIFKKRLGERIIVIDSILNAGFDYTIDEYYVPDRSEEDFPETYAEMNELWRMRLKNEALRLKMAGKEDDEIPETLLKRYQNIHRYILQYDEEDAFQLYMNAFAGTFDPHTEYFSPITSDNFNIRMSLSLEGIGAQLSARDEYTTVVRIIAGGPADKDGRLDEDDKIVGVGQGEDGEIIDVIGWRIDDVVQLIRGEKGTKVRLQVLKGDKGIDAHPEEIVITRDKIKLEEQSAHKKIIELENGDETYQLGVINIPAFYIDFEDKRNGNPEYKSTTRDVAKLVDELKEAGVDGIIIDLRNNGGGSLEEAISLTGLFIEDGPVVQVRQSNGEIDIEDDPDPRIQYDGPLAVLVNRYSASASEIFSGAIQDYERGIVIGEQTYGKGTVQNLVDLSRYVSANPDNIGRLKLTIAKFYRVTGGSTQHRGVVPDIIYPTDLPPEEYGESSWETALPYDEIDPAEFTPFSHLKTLIPPLVEKHNQRIADDLEFQFYLEDIEEAKKLRQKERISLLLENRKRDQEEREAVEKQRDEERLKSSQIKLIDMSEVTDPESEEEPFDDILLEETAFILTDFISMFGQK